MVNSEATSEQPIIGLIPLHFDIPGNCLPLATFVDTANQTRAVIDAFNRDVFAGELQFEFFVLPPEEGSFKTGSRWRFWQQEWFGNSPKAIWAKRS